VLSPNHSEEILSLETKDPGPRLDFFEIETFKTEDHRDQIREKHRDSIESISRRSLMRFVIRVHYTQKQIALLLVMSDSYLRQSVFDYGKIGLVAIIISAPLLRSAPGHQSIAHNKTKYSIPMVSCLANCVRENEKEVLFKLKCKTSRPTLGHEAVQKRAVQVQQNHL